MEIKQFHNKNQIIKKEGKSIILQSYTSDVLKYDMFNDMLKFGKDWNYSNTTLKHIYLFIDEFVDDSEIRAVKFEKYRSKYLQQLVNKKVILIDNELKSI